MHLINFFKQTAIINTSATPIETPVDTKAIKAQLDTLNLADLVKLADSNIELRPLIEKRYIIKNYRVENSFVELQIRGDHYTLSINDSRDNKIDQFEEILQFFKHFGSHVKQLRVYAYNVRTKKPSFKQLGQFIEQFCSEALKAIQLLGDPHRWISHWKLPLEKVQSVKLTLRREETVSMVNRLFPNIETLDISVEKALADDDEFHFPNMTHLIYDDDLSLRGNMMLMYFVHANPQIRKLNGRMNYLSPENIIFINHRLPNLESLQFKTFLQYYSNIHAYGIIPFANVRELSLELIPYTFRPTLFPLIFAQLESLDLYHGQFSNAAAIFILSNKYLQRLSIPVMPMSDQHLNWFVNQLPELNELTILWDEEILTVEQILNILNRDSYLKQFTLMIKEEKPRMIDQLLQAVPPSWSQRMTHNELYEMCQIQFERTGEFDERKSIRSGFA